MSTPTQQPEPSPRPRSMYAMGSLPNMLRSLLVIGLMVFAVYAIVPRSSELARPAVDATSVATTVRVSTGWQVRLPQGLPQQWRPTVATDAVGTGGVRTFTTVWATPGGQDIALKQAQAPNAEWLARSVQDGVAGSRVQLGGEQWQQYARSDGSRPSLVLTGTGDTPTIVASGTASEQELTELVAALRPLAP